MRKIETRRVREREWEGNTEIVRKMRWEREKITDNGRREEKRGGLKKRSNKKGKSIFPY